MYVSWMIRGMPVDEAIRQLKFVLKKGATDVIQVLEEAKELAVKEHNVEFPSNMWVCKYAQTSVPAASFWRNGFSRIVCREGCDGQGFAETRQGEAGGNYLQILPLLREVGGRDAACHLLPGGYEQGAAPVARKVAERHAKEEDYKLVVD